MKPEIQHIVFVFLQLFGNTAKLAIQNGMQEFKDVDGIHGIKFQPFKYDRIASEDFSWYEVYKKLYFTEEQWKKIINEVSSKMDVWIDTFDDYSLKIIEQNIEKIHGLKFQSSILFNKKLLKQFEKVDLTNKKIILNIH